jgi:tetratricopeptide (TPR) repeat protein
MKRGEALSFAVIAASLAACATAPPEATIKDLNEVEPNLETAPVVTNVVVDAEESYRRYLDAAPDGAESAEAMRRMADLQIEKVYGVVGTEPDTAMPTPKQASPALPASRDRPAVEPRGPAESDAEFERRTTRQDEDLLRQSAGSDDMLPIDGEPVPAGPLEAIETYKKILADYRNYARKDEVLYQLARAYDEIGQPEEAIKVMERLVADYPYTRTADEVNFRRGEYYFTRKRWRDAQKAYDLLAAVGPDSQFYEHGLYKLGWSLYKQAFYEEALDNFVGVLDHRKMNGYVFDQYKEEGEAHRVTDTFRVISLCVDNLGGPDVLEEYFEERGQRDYTDKIYANLAEYYFEKRRFDDAATVYRAFVELNPMHKVAPTFSRRAIEIFEQAGFPQRVVEAKKEFSTRFALASTGLKTRSTSRRASSILSAAIWSTCRATTTRFIRTRETRRTVRATSRRQSAGIERSFAPILRRPRRRWLATGLPTSCSNKGSTSTPPSNTNTRPMTTRSKTGATTRRMRPFTRTAKNWRAPRAPGDAAL